MVTVFFDRDGVINKGAPPHRYITAPEDLVLLSGAAEGIAKLNRAGFLCVIVTNQQGIGKGMFTQSQLDAVHGQMERLLKEHGAHIDKIYCCPHRAGECRCRKPDTGMLEAAQRDFNIDKNACWMIGDSESDIICGKRFGAATVLIGCENSFGADYLCPNLKCAAELICKIEQKNQKETN